MADSEHGDHQMPPHGSFCWTEIASSDSRACIEFYTNVFGWKFQESQSGSPGMEYTEYSTGDPYPAGGLYQIDPQFFGGHAPPPHIMNYVAVDNVDASAERAVELGGTIINGPMDIPNVGRMAIIKDPTGATLSLFAMGGGGSGE